MFHFKNKVPNSIPCLPLEKKNEELNPAGVCGVCACHVWGKKGERIRLECIVSNGQSQAKLVNRLFKQLTQYCQWVSRPQLFQGYALGRRKANPSPSVRRESWGVGGRAWLSGVCEWGGWSGETVRSWQCCISLSCFSCRECLVFFLSLNNADLLGRVLQGHGGIACRSKSERGKWELLYQMIPN